MKNLLNEWGKIKHQYIGKHIVLFLDYDGTLSPIAKTPDLAKTPLAVNKLLKEISDKSWLTTCIVSGRSLAGIKNKIGLNKLIYAGNHGIEIMGPSIKHIIKPTISFLKIKSRIRTDIRNRTRGIKGVLIEDKGSTLAVHYRMVKTNDVPAVKKAFMCASSRFKANRAIQVQSGKKVYEIRPNIDWDKGKAVIWILDQFRKDLKYLAPIYIGDDITDEDAFRALKNKGLTVFVGKGSKTMADYYLKNVPDVIKALNMINNGVS